MAIDSFVTKHNSYSGSFLFLSDHFKQKMVIGAGGQLIARIAREAGLDLSSAFMCEVRLKLSVTLKS